VLDNISKKQIQTFFLIQTCNSVFI